MIRNKKEVQGFSLIEVLIAIAIVSLIAVVSLPIFSMGIKNIKSSETNSEDLFDIQYEIENDVVDSNLGIEQTLSFKFTGYTVDIPVLLYEVKKNVEDIVSITYFELR